MSGSTRRPCIVGIAQKGWRDAGVDAPHPLAMAAEMARAAALDSGNAALLAQIDELDVVRSLSWFYDDASAQLAQILELPPGARQLSGLSGTSAQRFVNDAAEAIVRGERRAVLVCGAEAFATVKRAGKEGRRPDWPVPQSRPSLRFDDPPLPTEIAHKVSQAYTTFSMLDLARRARVGVAPEVYRHAQAQTMASLSEVAAKNPLAWFPKAYSAAQLFDTGNGNRMVSYPYSKNMMAFMEVDMAAAVIVVDDALADEFGIAQEKRVYLHGWAYAKEPPHIAQRDALDRCPSMEYAAQSALMMAGKHIDDIQHLDLYSCFPGSLAYTRDALGIAEDDTRPLTITGGLPYFGGPGNNYMTHSIAAIVEILRRRRDDFGLVSGVGMHMTNHVFAVYGSAPPSHAATAVSAPPLQPTRPVRDQVNGEVTVLAYTVTHDAKGGWATTICELDDGSRCYALCDVPETLRSMECEEWVGRRVTVAHDGTVNRFS